jgi:hypothetical protein
MILKPDSEAELRYTDQPLEVGQSLRFGVRPYVVVARMLKLHNPAATIGFVCVAPARAARFFTQEEREYRE